MQIVDTTCQRSAVKKNVYSHQQCLLHQTFVSGRETEFRVPANKVVTDHIYVTSVQPCFDDSCTPPVFSQQVAFYNPSSLTVSCDRAVLTNVSQSELAIEVQANVLGGGFNLPQSCFIQWAVSGSNTGSLAITGWKVKHLQNCSSFEINSLTTYRGDGEGSLFMCIRLVSPWAATSPQCTKFERPASSSNFIPFQLVELDHSTFRLSDLEPYIHSLQLGSNNLHRLFDLDLDFAPSTVLFSAILTNGKGHNVTWFLMTRRQTPSGSCSVDSDCVTSAISATGYVTFPRHRSLLRPNTVYYICALTWSTPEESYWPQKTATVVEVCGDGVVIDDEPPVTGTVFIENSDSGYLHNEDYVMVTWTGFTDVERYVTSLPDEITVHYSVALGSYPGGEDVVEYRQVGQRTVWVFQHLNLVSGTRLYATVRAEDRVGHVSELSSQPVIVDYSPPTIGPITIGAITHESFVSGNDLTVQWENIEDKESGISTLEVGVAQDGSANNVISFQSCGGNSFSLTDSSSLVDGHAYVVLLKVTNKAGLTTIGMSESFVIDNSPPSPGRVWNIGSNTSTPSGYVIEVGVLSVKWAGFTDPHSGLLYYRAGLGSRPGDSDVLPFVYVGLQTSHTWREDLDEGRKYYATVEACNRAGLCCVTSSGSLTFDGSPPMAGHVIVGLYGRHDKFLGHNTSVPVQWTGFSDPQTGIQHFTWCVGTTPLVCDIKDTTQTLLSSASHATGLDLPLATPLFVTVRARNPAGLETVSVSDSFQVDITPLEVLIKPHFLSPRDGRPTHGQWDRSVLRVAWQFRDPESSVVSHTVYVRSRLTGRLVVQPILLGPDDDLTLTLDQDTLLADGDAHWAFVTACNAAHLCVTANSDVINIDSTPPVTGTFLSPLTWTRGPSNSSGEIATTINIMWRGFSDAESGVTSYQLLAGKDYNGLELTGGRLEVAHDNVSIIQQLSLLMSEQLLSDELLHMALLAKNSLGLTSSLVRAAFRIESGPNAQSGSLSLVRHSCQPSYCSKECTCAAAGKRCERNINDCVQLNESLSGLSDFDVLLYMGPPGTESKDGGDVPHDKRSGPERASQSYSTSTKCLEGHWAMVRPESIFNVSRFQVSFGYAGMAPGDGVFEPQEPVWMDVGRHLTVVHCLPGNKTLKPEQTYIMHLQVWLSRDTYITFISSPMMVDHTPPQNRRGKSVIDSNALCVADIDYITSNSSHVTACWNGVFQDSQSGVSRYQVWMGTSAAASDLISLTDVGTNTNWTFPTMHLEQGTRYYVAVRAWNEAGLHTTTVSDGFLVDFSPPEAGVVFNTGHHSNVFAQASTDSITPSWHGFEDRYSGVKSYLVAVYDADNDSSPVMPFTDADSTNAISLKNLTLEHKHRYKVAVKAKDASGQESTVVESPPILVDVTPPEGVTCSNFRLHKEANLTVESSNPHDRYVADLSLDAVDRDEVVRVEIKAELLSPFASGFLQVTPMKMPLQFRFSTSGGALAQHDFLSRGEGSVAVKVVVKALAGARIEASIYKCVTTVISPEKAVNVRQLSMSSVSICALVHDRESGLRKVMVAVGTTVGGLQVAPWTAVGHSGHVTVPVHVQHASPLFATVVTQNQAGLWSRFVSRQITMDRTPPVINDVTVNLSYTGEGNAMEVWTVGRWTATDEESGVEFCTCVIVGQPKTIIVEQSFNDVTGRCQWQLPRTHHGSEVAVAVTCVNKVQLVTVVTSHPAYVLLQPPDVSEVVLSSVPNNALTSPYHSDVPLVRSSNSSVQFFWHGLQDPTVTAVNFRFLQQSRALTEWSPLPAYKTSAVLEQGMGRSGEVTAQLQVANHRQMTSQVSASVQLDDTRPQLTGQKAKVSIKDSKQLHLDWSGVFRATRDVTFSIFVGSQAGYGDVINHVTTSANHYEGKAAEKVPSAVYVIIQAVYDNGLDTLYSDTVLM